MNRLAPLAAAAAVSWVGLTGCSSSTAPPASFCVPRITIEPGSVSRGETIVLESDTVCKAEHPSAGWSVVAFSLGESELAVSAMTDESFDGSFRVAIVIPESFPAGDAYAEIENWDYSVCSDSASCAGAGASFTVKR
jgi:hypothetical protein